VGRALPQRAGNELQLEKLVARRCLIKGEDIRWVPNLVGVPATSVVLQRMKLPPALRAIRGSAMHLQCAVLASPPRRLLPFAPKCDATYLDLAQDSSLAWRASETAGGLAGAEPGAGRAKVTASLFFSTVALRASIERRSHPKTASPNMEANEGFCRLVLNHRDILRFAGHGSDECKVRPLGLGLRRRWSLGRWLWSDRRHGRAPGRRKQRPFPRGGELVNRNTPPCSPP
jgi:hypothetical protein